ncbi:DUF1761 domain-containing protein [Spongiibacter sp.]|uniref:DUF1761 domain-containing protein n=1 Tax=Spongiibacter sp. TaxID=2024860 RepID=UPI003565CF1B
MAVDVIDVLLATITGMVLGALWYSPALFGNAWLACVGKTPQTLEKSRLPIVGSVLASALQALAVVLLHSMITVSSAEMALELGVLLAGLVIFPAMLSDNLFCGWGLKLLLIQVGYRALSVILMSLLVFWL